MFSTSFDALDRGWYEGLAALQSESLDTRVLFGQITFKQYAVHQVLPSVQPVLSGQFHYSRNLEFMPQPVDLRESLFTIKSSNLK